MQREPIPLGLCQCGCGQRTKIAAASRPQRGQFYGQPLRFIHGHHGRKPVRWKETDRGYKTPCWIWQLKVSGTTGYGLEKIGARNKGAHVMAYRRAGRVIPHGYTVDHLCRQRDCVNPAHLEAVPHWLNCLRGAQTKLSLCSALQVRIALFSTSLSQEQVGEMFGISQQHVSALKRGLLRHQEVLNAAGRN